MLEEQEKNRIRLEETYRAEVRAELERTKSVNSKNHAWTFLNSAFGLWLLSAVLISGAGALITRYQAHQTETKRNTERVERLDIEISYRLSQVLIRLYDVTDKSKDPKLGPNHTPEDVTRVLALLTEPRADKYPPLYSEFASIGLPGLMAELRRNLPESERPDVDRAIAAITGGPIADGAELANVQLVGGRLIETVVLRRAEWTKTYFPFIDCPPEAPFC